jgi:hypothetical protein
MVAIATAVRREDVWERRSVAIFIDVHTIADRRAVLQRIGENTGDRT